MKNFKNMVVLTAFIAAFTACKKEKETEQPTPEIQTTASSSEFSDIHLCTELPIEGVNPRAASIANYEWTNGSTLVVSLNGGTPYVRNKVKQYAVEWSNYANIYFRFVENDNSADIRVTFVQDGKSWSSIGTNANYRPYTQATMNFGWFNGSTSNAEFKRTTLHEFGHALGLIHEHQNPIASIPWDKPKVYAYYAGAPNYWSKAQVDLNLFTKYSEDQSNYSYYDKYSIMHYTIPEQLTIGTYSVGTTYVLSDTDKAFIAAIYPK